MYALIVQYKDPCGTIFIIKTWTTASGVVKMEQMAKIETMSSSFTTFASTILKGNGEQYVEDHITIVTQDVS